MIKFVTGKPGGGKTLRVMQLLFNYLEHDDRPIVTNLPLHLDRIQEYTDKRGWGIDVEERILILDDDALQAIHEQGRNRNLALSQFYRFRSKDVFMPLWEPGDILDWSHLYKDADGVETGYKGTVFIVDEIHKLWPSRSYGKTDTRVFEYLAEHRHLGDEVIFISQHLAQVDKQIRILGQDFEVMRNRGKEKYAWFAGPKVFRRSVYLRPPTGSTMDQPAEVNTFRLNKEQAECYETSAQGGQADKGQTAKGIPYPILWGGLIGAALLVWLLVTKLPSILLGTTDLDDELSKPKQEVTAAPTNQLISAPTKAAPQKVSEVPAHEEKRYWRSIGRLVIGNETYVTVRTSDGRLYTEKHEDLERVDFRHGVVQIDGQNYYQAPSHASKEVLFSSIEEQGGHSGSVLESVPLLGKSD